MIALAKVVDLLKKGGYTRIVLDTAPTGHTLRMLTFPRFVDDLIEKVVKVAERVKSTAMMLNSNIKEVSARTTKTTTGARSEAMKRCECHGVCEKLVCCTTNISVAFAGRR